MVEGDLLCDVIVYNLQGMERRAKEQLKLADKSLVYNVNLATAVLSLTIVAYI
jgi:hypothetical protein